MADTIALMRERVLDMAIRGELVEQRLEEGTSESLVVPFNEKTRESRVTMTNNPVLPNSWEWTMLSDIADIIMGQSPPGSSVSIENEGIEFHQGKIYFGEVYLKESDQKTYDPKKIVDKDTLLLSVRAPVGNLNITQRRISIGRGLCGIKGKNGIETKFLYYFLTTAKEAMENKATGTTFKAISGSVIRDLSIPLPPLSEQKRIVAKIEEIFAVIDQIGTKKEEALSIIRSMRQTALQDAIMGVLVEQDETDESANEILKKIEKEKEHLKKEKKVKIEQPLPPVNVHNFDYDIPAGWELTHLNEIAFVTKLAGFEYTSDIKPNLAESGIPLFKGKNVQNGRLVYEFESFIPESVSEKLTRSQLNRKCLLTPYVGTIGNIAIFEGDIQAHLGSNVGKIELYNYNDTYILEEYLLYFLRSKTGIKQLRKQIKSTAQESISIKAIRECLIPLPPLAEQERIVAKLDEIMAICDQMEAIFDGSADMVAERIC